jgi:hypothetical protein
LFSPQLVQAFCAMGDAVVVIADGNGIIDSTTDMRDYALCIHLQAVATTGIHAARVKFAMMADIVF